MILNDFYCLIIGWKSKVVEVLSWGPLSIVRLPHCRNSTLHFSARGDLLMITATNSYCMLFILQNSARETFYSQNCWNSRARAFISK